MSEHGRKPIRWANDINTILAAIPGDRFPIDVETLAVNYSRQRFPGGPIIAVEGGALGSFEGALYPIPEKQGWAIIYNNSVSPGRRRWTVSHEFGHYLMHRGLLPDGIQCGEDAVTFRSGQDLEQEADRFAAYLLMPFDDFRAHFAAEIKPRIDDLSAMAERYGVSLISCILRWLEYTSRRSMLVVSRDGFILWAASSKGALQSGLFYRTRLSPPIEVPAASLVGRQEFTPRARSGVVQPAAVWLGEDCEEITLRSDKYDQSIALLHFANAEPRPFGTEYIEACKTRSSS
jgi:IrrE N-terminal-like domain